MRLWQKIFLLSLLLSTLAINSVSFLFLIRSQRNTLLLEKEKALTACDALVTELEHSIREEKENKGYILLTADELDALLSERIFSLTGDRTQVAITPVSVKYGSVSQLPADRKNSLVTLLNVNSREYNIRVDTTAFWEGHFYRVSASYDVSAVFAGFHEDIVFSQWIGGTVSLLIAAVLLAAIRMLTQPLKRLETATRRIAAGSYQERLTVKGHDEIAELSQHMNNMSSEIEANIRKVEQVAENRKTFIANMAHELKTPLTSILGFADILTIKSSVTEAERREYASIIAAEAKRLRLLSSRLMELVSLEETELELKPASLKELVEQAVEIFSPIGEEYQCPVRLSLEPLSASVDRALFTSLILNLLDNARKASPPGCSIDITLSECSKKAVLQIRDHGAGIPQEQLSHVTEPFYMVDKTRSRKAGGSGIGLSLCKKIVEAHHGILQIKSQENYGTRVTIIFPLFKYGDLGCTGLTPPGGRGGLS